MYDLIKEKGLSRTLETGFAYARSASYIMAATGSTHIACDPFQIRYGSLGLKNVEKLGMKDQLDFRPDFSHNVMPHILADGGEQFDFIFIDGDHKFDGELVDFYYADLLLEKGGYVLLHDTWMRSTSLVQQFIHTNRKDYKRIDTGLRNLALYQKVGEDTRDGMHFREFFTFRSILSHPLIIYMTSPGDSWLKRSLIKVKDIFK